MEKDPSRLDSALKALTDIRPQVETSFGERFDSLRLALNEKLRAVLEPKKTARKTKRAALKASRVEPIGVEPIGVEPLIKAAIETAVHFSLEKDPENDGLTALTTSFARQYAIVFYELERGSLTQL